MEGARGTGKLDCLGDELRIGLPAGERGAQVERGRNTVRRFRAGEPDCAEPLGREERGNIEVAGRKNWRARFYRASDQGKWRQLRK